MGIKESIESYSIGFLPSVTSLLSIFDENKQLITRRKDQYQSVNLKENPTTILDMERWIDSHFYHNEFEPLLIQSLFISLYSLFESQISSLSKAVESSNVNIIKINDLRGNGIIDKYRKYLDLVCDLESVRQENDYWVKFKSFQFLRNRIVHNESYLTNDRLNFLSLPAYHLLAEYPDSKVNSEGKFSILNPKFIEDFGTLIIEMSFDLVQEMKQKYS